MRYNEYGITTKDRISKYLRELTLLFVILPIIVFIISVTLLDLWFQIISEFGIPELLATGISLSAILITVMGQYQSKMLFTRQEDIKALHGLRELDILLESSLSNDSNDLLRIKDEIERQKETSLKEINEAIPGTSARFREALYEISERFRRIPDDYIINYLLRRTIRERINEEESLGAPTTELFGDLAPLALDPRIDIAMKLHDTISRMRKRMEFIYFGKSFNSLKGKDLA